MTDVENIIISRLSEISTSQVMITDAIVKHVADDSTQFKDILVMIALNKGQVKGFLITVSLLSSLLGGILTMVTAYLLHIWR